MIARIGIFVLWLLHFLPFRILVGIGNLLGLLLYALAHERRRVADINLRLCFPHMGDMERTRLVRRNFQAFGRSIIERSILWWASGERIKSLIRVEGAEHFYAVKGKPVILLTPHFVGMDVGGSWIAQHVDVICVYSKQKNRYLSDLYWRNEFASASSGSIPVSKGCARLSKRCARGGLSFTRRIRIKPSKTVRSFHFSGCLPPR